MLNTPKLAGCSDRNLLAKTNEVSGSPEEWFDNNLLMEQGLFGISFDFYINWATNPYIVSPDIWIKRVLKPGMSYDQFMQDVTAVLQNEFGMRYLNHLRNFANSTALSVSFIIFDDTQNWQDDTSMICMVQMDADGDFNPQLISIKEFKELIKKLSGGPVTIGRKGLIYGTSLLECFLSNTNSLYPGDLDMLLLNENYEVLAILEFKKHTLDDNISGQTFSNYYPNPDRRKYDRLAIFKEYILEKTSNDVPIIVLYYPSRSTAKQGKMEALKGKAGNLEKKVGRLFELPSKKELDEFHRIVTYLPKIIELYNE